MRRKKYFITENIFVEMTEASIIQKKSELML